MGNGMLAKEQFHDRCLFSVPRLPVNLLQSSSHDEKSRYLSTCQ